MKQPIHTVCARDCYDTCSLSVAYDDEGRPAKITGDPADPITRGTICPRGAADLARLEKNRIRKPHIRKNGRLVPDSWDAALSIFCTRISSELASGHPERTLLLDYAGNMGLLSTVYPRRLWHALGATMTDGTVCSTSGKAGIRLHYGGCHGIDPVDLPHHPLIVFWGFNAAVSAPHLWRLAVAARRTQGTRIAVVDPVRTPTADAADIWLRPKPGTDVALAYGIINAIVGQQAHEEAFISEWTTGFDALMEKTSAWTPTAVRAATGVSSGDLSRLVDAYAQRRPAATLIGIGLQKQTAGADAARAAALIPAVLGQHRGFFYSSADAHTVDMARITGKSLASVSGATVSQVGLARLVERGDFGVVFVSCMNPALTLPGQAVLRRGMERPDVFVAVHDTHWTRTCEFADVVLPALTYLEKDDLVIPWSHSRIRRSRKIVKPVTDGWSEVALMQTMARRLGRKEPWLFEDPWKALQPALAGQFREGGVEALYNGETCYLSRKPADRYGTESGKIEFRSRQAEILGFAPLPEVAETNRPGWVMLNSALPAYTHSQFQEIYGPIPATAVIHPDDAAEAEIQDGDAVVLSNAGGTVTLSAVVSDMVPRGVVQTPRQFEDRNGIPQNVLTSPSPQAIGGGATFNATRVTVTRASG